MTEQQKPPHAGRRGLNGVALQIMGEVRQIFVEHEAREGTSMRDMKQEIKQNNADSNARHEQMLDRFEGMQAQTTQALESTNQLVSEIHKLFKKAFPDGDVDAHRKAHEHWIAKDLAEKDFWLKIKQDVVKWVAVAAIGWGGIVIWAAFLKGPTP